MPPRCYLGPVPVRRRRDRRATHCTGRLNGRCCLGIGTTSYGLLNGQFLLPARGPWCPAWPSGKAYGAMPGMLSMRGLPAGVAIGGAFHCPARLFPERVMRPWRSFS